MKLAQYIYIYIYSGISILSNSPETNRVPCHLAGNERYPRARGGNSFIHPAPRVEIFPRCAQFSTEKSARNDVLRGGSIGLLARIAVCASTLPKSPLFSSRCNNNALLFRIRFHSVHARIVITLSRSSFASPPFRENFLHEPPFVIKEISE